MNNIFQYIVGFFINFLNDLQLFRYLATTTSKNFLMHSRLVFSIFFKYLKNRSFYKKQIINLTTLKRNKKTDKLFIFGSGRSLNEIENETWAKIDKNDCLGFNGSYHLEKVNFTYHVLRAGHEDPTFENKNKLEEEISYAKYTVKKINKNIFLDKTIFLFSSGISQHFPNLLLGYKLWNKSNQIFQYRTNKVEKYPKGNMHRGLSHRSGTLIDAITFGYHMGYKEIVLIGVDLYDNQYFWVEAGKTIWFDRNIREEVISDTTNRGIKYDQPHNTVNNGLIELINDWNIYFKKNNIKLSVFNPKSLLNKVLPIYKI